MINKIKDILSSLGIETWRVTETKSETAELYYIKKKLDMPRIKELTLWNVEVFKDFEKDSVSLRGTSSVSVAPGMSCEEIKERISSAYYAAGFAANKYYPLPAAVTAEHVPCLTDLAGIRAEDAAKEMASALFSADTSDDAFINSAEIFSSRKTTRICSSEGTDVSFDSCRVSGELVTQSVTPIDVEQYRAFDYDTLDKDSIAKLASEAIEDVRARARTSTPPKAGTYDILLKGEHLANVLSYYATRSNAAMIYPGYSRWEEGQNVQGDDISGEKLCLQLVPDAPFSGEGIPMVKRSLLEDGVLKCVYGASRFCYYLGKEPTGQYGKISCTNGTVSVSSMRKEGVLEPVSFSDFQMDEMDGHFKGEIRLALLHHADGSIEEVTGGSINGSITDAQKSLLFSTDRFSNSDYEGPLAVLIPDVMVAGA